MKTATPFWDDGNRAVGGMGITSNECSKIARHLRAAARGHFEANGDCRPALELAAEIMEGLGDRITRENYRGHLDRRRKKP